jgi:phosphate ABC transporter phosphate-binding protein
MSDGKNLKSIIIVHCLIDWNYIDPVDTKRLHWLMFYYTIIGTRIMHQKKVLYGVLAGLLMLAPILFGAQRALAQNQVTLNGAGATFPFPLIDTWRVEYGKANPSVSINYQSIGSGGGIKQFTEKTVDFGVSDAPLNQAQRAALPGTAVHIPETIGSVVAAYNVPGVSKGLKLTGPVLADIFLGKIKNWNDPAIANINPGVNLSAKGIVVVHRADGSGTTFIWTSYLSLVSADWKNAVGKGTAVQWPTGLAAPGNEGVANTIRSTPYSLGYVELAYALTSNMTYGNLQNKAGNFVEPSLETTKNAVSALATTLPKGEDSWENVAMLDAPGPNSYPIASFSYILLYKDMSTNPKVSEAQAREIVKFVSWAVTDGQKFASKLEYVPLPEAVTQHNLETLKSLTYGKTTLETAVVPEFGVVAALVLGVSIVGVLAIMRIKGVGEGGGFGRSLS